MKSRERLLLMILALACQCGLLGAAEYDSLEIPDDLDFPEDLSADEGEGRIDREV